MEYMSEGLSFQWTCAIHEIKFHFSVTNACVNSTSSFLPRIICYKKLLPESQAGMSSNVFIASKTPFVTRAPAPSQLQSVHFSNISPSPIHLTLHKCQYPDL
jgi:hypothetical protein